jgi:hypothetical protein
MSRAERSGRRAPAYLWSLPERAVRSLSAVSGGLLRELGQAALPAAVRRTSLYRTMIEQTLRFLIEQVGEVEGAYPGEDALSEGFALRRAAGNGLEMIGLLTFRASPVWVMAALADVSGTGRLLVRDIAASLKQEGLLDPQIEFDTVDRILDGLQHTSARVAETINTPPLDIASLRREWAGIRQAMRRMPPERRPSSQRLWRDWRALRREADSQRRSVFDLSTLLALSALERVPQQLVWASKSAAVATRRAGGLFAGPLLDHYAATLSEIHTEGFLGYWKRQFRPYLRAAAAQFAPDRTTLTDRVLARRGARRR